jgi:hypothetical protein
MEHDLATLELNAARERRELVHVRRLERFHERMPAQHRLQGLFDHDAVPS